MPLWGGRATLLAVVGQHPLAEWIKADLQQYQVELIDLMPERLDAPTVSSIVVSGETGDRAVISKNAQGLQVSPTENFSSLIQQQDVVLLDGHQMALSQAIAPQAAAHNIPRVFDGGSWKAGTDHLIPHVSHLVLSANFQTPSPGNEFETLQQLRAWNPEALIATTHGEHPILWQTPNAHGQLSCRQISAIDTLGAGDFFHGAFAYALVAEDSFESALQQASAIATLSCEHPGTRQWIGKIIPPD